ncbi:MAG: carboxypeptidase regulatory-like domain-containing protein, partial [Acidobacteria bacterium]|nr:carboxypeptidase regulatory-like domain-containing protein [Acidobacteriota bacterium]
MMATIPQVSRGIRAWQRFIVGAALVMSIGSASTAFAQSVASGTIEGTVKDESGSVLPGVTVTASSPQLQVGQLVQVSDTTGAYKFVDLPAGTYRVRAELQGFSATVHDDLRLTVGFTARVDLTMKVGALEESITVSGQSPVVDVTNTTASVAFTKEVLDSIPRG